MEKKEWTLKNTGSLPGRLLVRLENVENINRGCNDQKRRERPNCDNEDFGMLGQYINLTLELDGREMASSTLADEDQNLIRERWSALDPIIFQPGDEKTIKILWSSDPDNYGNEIQADEVRFDISFRLIQRLEPDVGFE